ncbi:4923_t:CDS:1 [Acaulospora morrowiae]|uniref:4923_t:CDS:1 n=1 Tax=Acaulospora morrowiae TaxID=94023 RepID=A0A9N9ER85_9GLOM|nr:4923_t:CDS:1 [Acaulospora morrowiae]
MNEFDDYKDKSHLQFFFDITKVADTSKLTPKYFREVYRPDGKYKLYWFKDALKRITRNNQTQSLSTSPTTPAVIWTIEPIKLKFSKIFKKVRRPKKFDITFTGTGSRSHFEFGGGQNEPLGYSGDAHAPFDNTCVQRYRWVRYGDGSKWVFIVRNDPRTPLVEFRKTEIENEFTIVFLEDTPPSWNPRIARKTSDPPPSNPSSPTIIYPSGFTVTSSLRDSATTGIMSDYSSFRGSAYSDASGQVGIDKHPSILGVISNTNKFETIREASSPTDTEIPYEQNDGDLNKYWIEFVLASTVAIQDEVNSRKHRLWKSHK